MTSISAVELTMKRIEAQSVLFAERPSRLSILSVDCDFTDAKRISVNVWRNHAFEPIMQLAQPYCFWGRWQAEFRVSDYDDTLMFAGHVDADVELLWLDRGRYAGEALAHGWFDWLQARIQAVRALSAAPIVIATWFDDAAASARLHACVERLPGVHFADLGEASREAGLKLTDRRTAAIAGTPLSSAAQLWAARKLACHWLPAATLPPVKAVALDLDHTLHAGVLGEDGIDGVVLTEGHRQLQSWVKQLQLRGIFVALVSKNERADVEALFDQRKDYPLRWEDFSATEISWGDKSSAIGRIAETLRIATDAILYVDDNPGELANVSARLGAMPAIHANSNALLTLQAIQHYPGLWRWNIEADDEKRVRDLKANAERETLLAVAGDQSDYFRSLGVSVVCRLGPVDQLGRLADLCNKTNQFNLAMRRFNQAEIAARLESPASSVASVQLTDRLSDSGVVAVVVADRVDDQLVVEELCVSCRALGRQLEDTVILTAIRSMPIFEGCRAVAFRANQGPRNQPALEWLGKLLGGTTVDRAGLYPIPKERIQRFVPAEGVAVVVEPVS